jgi:hypothetical protein
MSDELKEPKSGTNCDPRRVRLCDHGAYCSLGLLRNSLACQRALIPKAPAYRLPSQPGGAAEADRMDTLKIWRFAHDLCIPRNARGKPIACLIVVSASYLGYGNTHLISGVTCVLVCWMRISSS